MVISWHVSRDKWRLLARKWWEKVLCIECFFALVSKRQNRLTIFSMKDFGQVVICAKRVRGYLHDKPWPFKVSRRSRGE